MICMNECYIMSEREVEYFVKKNNDHNSVALSNYRLIHFYRIYLLVLDFIS